MQSIARLIKTALRCFSSRPHPQVSLRVRFKGLYKVGARAAVNCTRAVITNAQQAARVRAC
jgi:hypothetical protein